VDGVISGAGSGFGASGGASGTATGAGGRGMTTTGRGGGGGAVVQADKARATIPIEASKLRRVDIMGTCMWLLILEAAVAMFLLVFIVWWTMYSGAKPNHDEVESPDQDERR
jgi:hypothetical protein